MPGWIVSLPQVKPGGRCCRWGRRVAAIRPIRRCRLNTPLELAILNQVDRFTLVIDAIDRVPRLQNKAVHLKESMKNEIIRNLSYAHERGTDRSEITDWTWPG